jgi:iron complex outermembrane receptor protein
MTFKHRYLSVAILAGTAILSANTAIAADNTTIEEVQVTGSYIKGTPGDSALPVQILDRSYIESQLTSTFAA